MILQPPPIIQPRPAPPRKVWICPERPDGSRVFSKKICVLEVRR